MKGTNNDIVVGNVGRVFGIKGWLRLNSFTVPKENILKYKPWTLKSKRGVVKLNPDQSRKNGSGLIIHFSAVDDRDEASRFVGAEISINRDLLPSVEEGDYYWADLLGLNVQNIMGESLGKIDQIIETGANDVLIVKGKKEILIPFRMGEVIKQVDLKAQSLVVEWDTNY